MMTTTSRGEEKKGACVARSEHELGSDFSATGLLRGAKLHFCTLRVR